MLGKVEIIVLGLLGEMPRHAYDIVRAYHGRSMGIWAEVGDASIYQALPRLERSGLIEIAQDGDGARKTYRLTRSGRKKLKESLLERLSSTTSYGLELNAALGFIHLVKPEEAARALEERREYIAAIIRSMGEFPVGDEEQSQALSHDMIAMQRYKLAEAEMAWLDSVIRWLDGLLG